MESSQTPKYCRSCGNALTPETKFCDNCGVPVFSEEPVADAPTGESPPEREKIETGLPDPGIRPKLGNAFSTAWDILMQDVVSGILVGLVFLGLNLAIACLSYFSVILMIPLYVGVFSWAEARRRGETAGANEMLNGMFARFSDGIALGGIFLLISLIFIIPSIALQFSLTGMNPFVPGWMSLFTSGSQPQPNFNPKTIGIIIAFVALQIFLAPAFMSLLCLASWAVARGHQFKVALSWAWERVRTRYFNWWWIGLIVGLMAAAGSFLCCVGIAFTIPLSYLTYAELAGDIGED